MAPDGAAVPMLFGKKNPLPADWWYPPEIGRSRGRLAALIDRSNRSGGHLVLFQTFKVFKLAHLPSLPTANPQTRLLDWSNGYVKDLFAHVSGDVVTCGSFVGRYQR